MSLRRLKNLVFWLPPESAIVLKLHPPEGGQSRAPSRPSRIASRDELRRFFGASAHYTPNN